MIKWTVLIMDRIKEKIKIYLIWKLKFVLNKCILGNKL